MMTADFMCAPDMSATIDGNAISNLRDINTGEFEIKIHVMLSELDMSLYCGMLGFRYDLAVLYKGESCMTKVQWYLNDMTVYSKRLTGVHAYLTFNDKQRVI